MYERHPLSAAFPDMDPEEFQDLLSSIKIHGQREPITLFENKILDGWHRYQACQKLEISPATYEFDGEDPVSYVIDLNLNRRHLSPSQKALAVVSCNSWRGVGKPVIPPRGGINCRQDDISATDMAKRAGVGTRTIERAKQVVNTGDQETLDKVRKGAISLSQALKAIDNADPSNAPPKPIEPRLPAAVSQDTYQSLKAEYESLKALYQELFDNAEEMAKELQILESIKENEHVELMKQMQVEIDSLTISRDKWQNECAELKKQVKYWKSHADRKPT